MTLAQRFIGSDSNHAASPTAPDGAGEGMAGQQGGSLGLVRPDRGPSTTVSGDRKLTAQVAVEMVMATRGSERPAAVEIDIVPSPRHPMAWQVHLTNGFGVVVAITEEELASLAPEDIAMYTELALLDS